MSLLQTDSSDAQTLHPPTSSSQLDFLCTLFDLCIAVAGAHPESLRGMQMMVWRLYSCVIVSVIIVRYFWISI